MSGSCSLSMQPSIGFLRLFPFMAPEYEFPVRRFLIRNSTYGVFYAVESRGLVILAVQDLRQSPEALRSRLRS